MNNGVKQRSKEQTRWDSYGEGFLKHLRENPDRYILQESPLHDRAYHDQLMGLLEPLQGRRILELGMGRGRLSVYLAKQGAKITGIDIAPRLVEAARMLARINEVDCDFQRANIIKLPVEDEQFDTVLGNMVLHYLSQPDLLKAFEDIRRVLKPDGIAIFVEPVENSRVFDLLQNLIPAGKRNTPYHRPSILQGEAWQRYVAAVEDRSLTNQELIAAGQRQFPSIQLTPYGFTTPAGTDLRPPVPAGVQCRG